MNDRHVCPVWVGYLLSSPLRKLIDNPCSLLEPFVHCGMTVIDAGCAMGFYSMPMARMVGPEGRVICVDLQERMVKKLFSRACKREIDDRIEVRVCKPDSLNLSGLEGSVDFALASAVVHEVPDRGSFFRDLFTALKPDGKLLVLEPQRKTSEEDFENMLGSAEKAGFQLVSRPSIRRRRVILLRKGAAAGQVPTQTPEGREKQGPAS